MNDDFRNTIKRLRDIYNYLTEGEPSPDEEEESQKEMISLLESLVMHIPEENMDENLELLKNTLALCKEWDTLEYWFKEKPDLVTNIKLILNRFLIRHAEPKSEPEPESTPTPEIPVKQEVPDELSNQLAAALERAMSNLPSDADVTKVIQSVTSQVTEQYMANSTTPKTKIGLGGVPINEKAESSQGSSNHPDSTIPHSQDSMTSTAARVKIRKEDIMKSVLEQVKNKINQDQSPGKLEAPKIIIPKVTKPKQKILPYSEESKSATPNEQIHPELESIPPMEPQEKPKQPPKLKISAFKKDKGEKPKIKTQVSSQSQKPIRPKVVVKPKPKIQTKVEELKPQKQEIKPTIRSNLTPEPSKPKSTKPKIKIQAKSMDKPTIPEKKDESKKSALNFNIVQPSQPSVKDTQVDLFETFAKQEKKDRKRKSKKKKVKLPLPEEKPQQSHGMDGSNGNSSPMENISFPEETIPYEKMDKAQLYQELIALEGKKYAIEKSRKDFKTKHQKGLISDGNYAAQLDRFKFDLNYISKKINEIRQRIQTL
jgi:hypothetical protein